MGGPFSRVHIGRRGKCGKIMFDKKSATTKKNFLEESGRERLRIYPCPECGGAWHLTSKTWMNKERME